VEIIEEKHSKLFGVNKSFFFISFLNYLEFLILYFFFAPDFVNAKIFVCRRIHLARDVRIFIAS